MGLGIKQFLTGLQLPQEYLCVENEKISSTLKVFLTSTGSTKFLDITTIHLFLGYKPLVIAVIYKEDMEELSSSSEVYLKFCQNEFSSQSVVASLLVKRIRVETFQQSKVVFYEGVSGQHRFIKFHQQKINSLFLALTKKPASNVSLDGNLYDQVRIAYAVPRIIALITVSDGTNMNLFPTDLHGPIGTEFYASSLRIGGEALKQVEQVKNIVMSEIDSTSHRSAYALGKNHMKKMQPENNFALSNIRSHHFAIPIPSVAGSYRELEVVKSYDVGIHRILIYKILHKQIIQKINTLAHVHQYYAQWRIDHNLKTDYLIR